jgi:hypothetical protein
MPADHGDLKGWDKAAVQSETPLRVLAAISYQVNDLQEEGIWGQNRQ